MDNMEQLDGSLKKLRREFAAFKKQVRPLMSIVAL